MSTDYGSPEANALLGGVPSSTSPSTSVSKTTQIDYGSPEANKLLGGSMNVTQTKQPEIAPATPVDTNSMFPKSSKIFPIDPNTSIIKNTIKAIPGAIAENLPFGIGDIVKFTKQDPLMVVDKNNAVTEQKTGPNFEDVLHGIVDTSKGLFKGIIGAGASLAGVPLKFNVPGLGEVSNVQMAAVDKIINSPDENFTKTNTNGTVSPKTTAGNAFTNKSVIQTILDEGVVNNIFNTLMLVGLAGEVAGPRHVTTAKVEIPADQVGDYSSVKNNPAPAKSFRLYDPQTATQPLTPDVVNKMIAEKGINPGAKYEPGLPTYFKMTSKPNGNLVGEVVQIKPSYLNTFLDTFTTKPSGEGLVPTSNSPVLSVEQIETIPKSQISTIITSEVNPNKITDVKNEAPQPPKAPELHPTLAAETKAHIDTHGLEATHQALQTKLGATPEQATKIIETVNKQKIQEALQNPEKTATEILNQVALKPEVPKEILSEKQLSTEAKKHDSVKDFIQATKDKVESSVDKKQLTQIYNKAHEPEVPPEVQARVDYHTSEVERLKDEIASHPGTKMSSFVDKKTGQFEDFKNPDVIDPKTGKFKYTPIQRARIKAQNAKIMKASESAFEGTPHSDHFDNPDAIREAIASAEDKKASLQFNKEMLANAKKGIIPQDDLTKVLESTPESAKIASSTATTGFEYNPESGFVSIKPIEEGINNVKDFIKETNKGVKAADNLDDSLYTLTKENEADKILAVKLTKKIDISPEDAEAIYHYEEDKSLPLTDHQQQVYDDSIKPLADASAKIANKLKDIIPVDSENYTPRFVAGKGNVIDRIKAGAQGIGGKGTVLGKNAPSLKHRTMKAVTDEQGNRFVVSIKNGVVTKLVKGKGGVIIKNSFNPKDKIIEETKIVGKDKNGKPVWRATGKKYSVGEATTKEIEANTNLTYHKNVFVNRLVTYLNLRQVERANDFLNAYKASKEFDSIGMKFGEGMAPKNWTTTVNPSFRGYMLEPHVADVMDKYASTMMKGKDPLRALTAMNSFLRTSIFFNPLIHIPNIGVHWLVNRGAGAFINPAAYKRLATTSVRAINAVVHQNEDYIEMLRSGAPLLYSSQNTRNMHNLLLGKMTQEIDKNPKLDFLKKALQSINPYVLSGKATWMINDIAVMQAIYEEMGHGKTMDEAIKDVGSHIPNYRVPANKVMELLNNSNITMFGAYHYGALRSYYEMAKTLVTGNTEGMINEGSKLKNKARRDVLDKLLMLAIIALVVYPAIDRALQKATGNPDTKMRRAGAATFPYNIAQLVQGKQDISQFIQAVITPAVGSKELASQVFNLDLFTGQHIRDKMASGADQFRESVQHAEKAIAPVAQYQKLDTGNQTKAQFLQSLVGISVPDRGRSKISNAILSAQDKVDKLDSDAVARVKETYDKAKEAGFGTPEADAIVEDLSDADYSIYKDLKAVDVAKRNLELVDKVEPIVRQAHDLGFDTEAADELVNKLSPEEFATYKEVKKGLYTNTNSDATAGNVPREWDKQSLIDHLGVYADAIGENPVQLFKNLFAGNQSYRIIGNENGQLMVARLDEENSQAIKKALGGATKEFKLDHTVPLEAGGNNGNDNLQLLSTDEWAANTKTENLLGAALKAGTITGKQAREYIIRFKKGLGETMSASLEKEYKEKYGGKPLTQNEIKSIINE